MNYKKVYSKYHGVSLDDFIPCKVCGTTAVDIHHILPKGRGGKDNIENLIALCRVHHGQAHGIGGKITEEYLFNL